MNARPAPPAVRLSAFYFVAFAAVGAFMPYWTLYLKSVGLDVVSIGEVVGAMTATGIVAPTLWGWVADRRGRRMPVVRACAAMGTLAFLMVLLHQGYWWLVVVICAYKLCSSGVLPQFEATTLDHLGPARDRYPRIRLWGSVGFIAATLALGELVERYGVAVMPPAVVVLSALLAVFALAVPEAPAPPAAARPAPFGQTLARPEVAGFLLACLLMQAAHMPLYVMFTIHLEAHGYAEGLIGRLWALAVAAEVAMFAMMPKLLARWSVERLFVACFLLGAVRWAIVAHLSEVLIALVLSQLLHAVTFGTFHACAIQLVNRLFPAALHGRGQALYAGVGFGAGGALGGFATGHAWAALGGAATWLAAALVSLAGGLMAWSVCRRVGASG